MTERRGRSSGQRNGMLSGGVGLGVDYAGNPVIDPTANVIALTEAANQRQDDLRDMNDRRLDAAIKHMEDLAVLRETHSKEIRELESKRLDAIRQVDVLAVNTAAAQALAAIQTLAATTNTNAENLRNALNITATTIATQLANTVAAINERIASLEKGAYTGAGKGVGTRELIGYFFAAATLLWIVFGKHLGG